MNNYIQQKLEEFDKQFGYAVPDEDGDYSMLDSIGRDAGCDDCPRNMEIRQEHKDFLEQALKDYAREVLMEAKLPEVSPFDHGMPQNEGWYEAVEEQKLRHQQILNNL